jgi:hypothetical protein
LIKPFLAMHGLMPQVQSAAPLPDAR